jgi:hypothetical protein
MEGGSLSNIMELPLYHDESLLYNLRGENLI